jgi:glutathione S-transferase
MEWVFAALNSVEMASLPWSILAFSGDTSDTLGWKRLDGFLKARLQRLEPVLAGREWLARSFSVADILMADVLRPCRSFRRAGEISRLS